jgi:hypothetical protein
MKKDLSKLDKYNSFNTARLEILNYVVQFCTQTSYPSGERYAIFDIKNSFVGGYFNASEIVSGQLCRLQSAPHTKWYLSWLMETRIIGGNETEYLLKSIEDGSLCWWSNVAINALPLEASNGYKSWKWSDAQFEFNDKWFKKACAGCYLYRPFYVTFKDDGSVTLDMRKMFDNEIINTVTFPNWKKVAIKQMRQFYLDTVELNK